MEQNFEMIDERLEGLKTYRDLLFVTQDKETVDMDDHPYGLTLGEIGVDLGLLTLYEDAVYVVNKEVWEREFNSFWMNLYDSPY